MLGVITLVYLLLSIFAGSTAAQEDPLCTDSYAEFQIATVGSNISGRDIRNQLYRTFYAPNQQLPYSVLVTYQLVLTNGTRANLSSDSECSSELWTWLSSPTLMVGDTSIGYTMRMRGYRIYTTEGEARGRVYSMTRIRIV